MGHQICAGVTSVPILCREEEKLAMKILIVSDSHGNLEALKAAVEREKPDQVFHLGDMVADARRLAKRYPQLPVACVMGNCDSYGGETGPDQAAVKAGGALFFLCHGHRYHVKLGVGLLMSEGRRQCADVVCFGHTHKAVCSRGEGGTWLVNPGSVGGVHAPATYAVAEAENGVVNVEIKTM